MRCDAGPPGPRGARESGSTPEGPRADQPAVAASDQVLDPVVAVDGGQSSTRVALVRGGQRVASGAGPGVPAPARERGPARIAEAVAAACADAGVDPSGLALAAGLTGLAEASGHVDEVAAALRARLGVARMRLAGDLVTAHLGALAGASGAMVAAGTGAVALAVGPDGASARVDGWGYLVGDAGSGFAVGRAGLRAALRDHDGRGGSAALAHRARGRFGALEALPGRLHAEADPAGVVAAFAPDVGAAAEAGDPVAAKICAEAAHDLAVSATTAATRALPAHEPSTVAWTGGLFALGARVREPFAAAVRERLPDAVVQAPSGTPLDGAAQLARGGGQHAGLVLHED